MAGAVAHIVVAGHDGGKKGLVGTMTGVVVVELAIVGAHRFARR